jgi:hypothetical protein
MSKPIILEFIVSGKVETVAKAAVQDSSSLLVSNSLLITLKLL